MKKNDFAEIKKMEVKVLSSKALKIKEEIANLVIDKNMNKMPNLKSIKFKRNELAKILTVLQQKQLMESLEKQTVKVSEEK
ncbi:MAG: 50S ribosomal protein L29 [Candidatus Daviesbacteria bacterium]|nr:50S ribosomal protein L29 [Candidatus Daviesbacteria bacterium]